MEVKGTQANPYSMSEYEAMANAGKWNGGYVRDDSGTVVYMMKELVVEGSGSGSGSGSESGSGSGSRFVFSSGSVHWHNPEDDDDNDDDDDDGNGNENPDDTNTPNGDGEWNPAGGGHGGHNNTNTNSVVGSFLANAPYYTEAEMEAMHAAGIWRGGNVYTLGYIGADYIIDSRLLALERVDESWITNLGDTAHSVLQNLKTWCQTIITSPYVQATANYYSATGDTLHIDASMLGLDNMPFDLLVPSKDKDTGEIIEGQYTINLFSEKLDTLLSNHTLAEKARIYSTAITLGQITLERVSGNAYRILPDTYNFELHKPWSEKNKKRNIGTILGKAVSEGISMSIDAGIGVLLGHYVDFASYVAAGLLRRYVIGTTVFTISIDGVLTIRNDQDAENN